MERLAVERRAPPALRHLKIPLEIPLEIPLDTRRTRVPPPTTRSRPPLGLSHKSQKKFSQSPRGARTELWELVCVCLERTSRANEPLERTSCLEFDATHRRRDHKHSHDTGSEFSRERRSWIVWILRRSRRREREREREREPRAFVGILCACVSKRWL